MKLKHYLAVAIIAALAGAMVPGLHLENGRVDYHLPWDSIVHAAPMQSVGGFQSWNNVHLMKIGADISDSASGGTGLQSMQGASFALPAGPAATWWVDCALGYSQATAAVADGIGISYSNSPTASQHYLFVSITAAVAPLGGIATNITNTTATAIAPAFTPSATATVYMANLKGIVEMPATVQDTIVQLSASQATQGDVMTFKRDGGCMYHSMQ